MHKGMNIGIIVLHHLPWGKNYYGLVKLILIFIFGRLLSP